MALVQQERSLFTVLSDGVLVVLGSTGATLGLFLVLPLIQAIGDIRDSDTVLRTVDSGYVPPPVVQEDEPEPEKEPEEEPPPEIADEPQRLDLAQLELALNPAGFGGAWSTAGFESQLTQYAATNAAATLFGKGDLEQKPRVIYQAHPVMTPKMRRKAPGSVVVIFLVDERGRVKSPMVEQSTDPIFNKAALRAVEKWEFEPGKRDGKPAEAHQRVTITFPQ